ncbi:MAG: hypothetical protein HYX74_00450, partial [Acidobacteria bacterium]|nr:hypothetical protein [Acidobacteriota bacterium]
LRRRVAILIGRAKQSLLLLIERKRSSLERVAASRAFASAENRLAFIAQRLDDVSFRMEGACRSLLLQEKHQFATLNDRLRRIDLRRLLGGSREKFHCQRESLQRAGSRLLSEKGEHLRRASDGLHAYSPLAVLRRGYAIVRKENRQIVKSVRDVHVGEDVRVHLCQGELGCRIQGLKS